MQAKPLSVRFISLGCPKNLVDSEILAGQLKNQGLKLRPSDSASDVCVINTCGFIGEAKEESINTILEVAEEKKAGDLKLLVVTGCLSQRYPESLSSLMPEVDLFLGTGDFSRLGGLIRSKLEGESERNFIRYPEELPTSELPRVYSTPAHMRFVKISEGCSHACSFCTIPKMRGGLKSRSLQDIICEMHMGIRDGVKEFNLIGQDLNEYGRDLNPRTSLYALFEEMAELSGNFWIRSLYMYPLQFPDRLIRLMEGHPHVIPYVDIPLQHIDDDLLRSMRRGSSAKYIYRLIENLRKIPGMILRTTFIVGYPGETDTQFQRLMDFVEEARFDRLGVFLYSDEEGTPAYDMDGKVPGFVAKKRRHALMGLQQKISLEKNRSLIGTEMDVLIEKQNGIFEGRYYGQAPLIDGIIKIRQGSPKIGEFAKVRISAADEYDLVGLCSK